jgi:lysophospholipase L1-like esterase
VNFASRKRGARRIKTPNAYASKIDNPHSAPKTSGFHFQALQKSKWKNAIADLVAPHVRQG